MRENAKLRNAAKELRENENITIKKADKSSIYVLMNTSEYKEKINNILADKIKFLKKLIKILLNN